MSEWLIEKLQEHNDSLIKERNQLKAALDEIRAQQHDSATHEQYTDVKSDLAAARLQTAMMVVCAKNLADERDALLATIELMQAKQQLVGYTMRSSLKPLIDDSMPDGKHIRIGVDHRVCWEDDTPYDNLIPLYIIGDV